MVKDSILITYVLYVREYHKTIEKVWDFSSQKMFW